MDSLVLIDKNGKIVAINSNAEQLFSYKKKTLVGQSIETLFPEDYKAEVLKEVGEFFSEKHIKDLPKDNENYTVMRSDGSEVPVAFGFIPLKIKDETLMLLLFRDNSKLYKLQRLLDEVGRYDILTNLPNRETCINELSKTLRSAKRYKYRFAVLFLDLDNFKMVNDLYGHAIGDAVLQNFAMRMCEHVRDTDFIARLGDDEFLLITQRIESLQEVTTLAEKIFETFSTPFVYGKHNIHVTVSIGIAIYPDAGEEVEILMQHADQAMYEAKNKGKNQLCFFSSHLSSALDEYYKVQSPLQDALEKNEFSLCYQPQLQYSNKKIVGFEVLIRWKNMELGAVSPARFIPIAEQSSLIDKIDRWVLEESCQFAKSHLTQHPDLILSINLSAVELQKATFCDTVISILEQHSLSPKQFCFELTETAIMKDPTSAIAQLKRLKGLGFKLSIDDFGMGYSSLLYLIQLPIDTIKIDKSFIDNILTDPYSQNVVKVIVSLAKSLNITTLAEGVETEKQSLYIEALGCNFVQGFYYYKPLNLKDVSCLLNNEKE